jgi:acyl-CoA synthetase (AMP-forming)/AMP-acid ligase II
MMRSLNAVLRENVRSAPQSTALVCGTDAYTYGQLAARSASLAALLRTLGVQRGDRIAWLGQNCHRWFECLFAAGENGAILCSLNWRLTAREQEVILRDIAPSLVIWQREALESVVEELRLTLPPTQWLCHDDSSASGYEASLNKESPQVAGADENPERPLLMLGVVDASGRSSGSMLSHTNLLTPAPLMAELQDITAQAVNLVSAPLYHIAALFTVFPSIQMRATNVVVPRADAELVCRAIHQHRCTHGFLLGPTAEACARENSSGKYDLRSFRSNLANPEWRSMVSEDPSLWGKHPGGYGQTETNMVVLAALARSSSMTSGRVAPYAQVRIVGSENIDAADDQAGEIVVRGASVHCGYWDRERVNEQRFRDGWWHTRDLGRRSPDGTITFLSPMGRLIKSGAENIYAAEIEICLARHPAIAEAAVIGVPDPVWVQSVKAIVVVKGSVTLSETDVMNHCREQLASYKKPRFVTIQAEPLPRAGVVVDYATLNRLHGGGGYPGEGTRSA